MVVLALILPSRQSAAVLRKGHDDEGHAAQGCDIDRGHHCAVLQKQRNDDPRQPAEECLRDVVRERDSQKTDRSGKRVDHHERDRADYSDQQDIELSAVLIDCSAQQIRLAAQRNKHFVHMPGGIRLSANRF
jgi:hypothetical protein